MRIDDRTMAILEIVAVLFFIPSAIIVGYLAKVPSWSLLAAWFRTRETPRGKKFGMQPGIIGKNGHHWLTYHADETGLFIAIIPCFRLGLPPMFIPWQEFRDHQQKKILLRSRGWCQFDEFSIGTPPITNICLPSGIVPAEILRTIPAAGWINK